MACQWQTCSVNDADWQTLCTKRIARQMFTGKDDNLRQYKQVHKYRGETTGINVQFLDKGISCAGC